jgi:hypothetical protein
MLTGVGLSTTERRPTIPPNVLVRTDEVIK